MSNVLTNLVPIIYEELDQVARERIGFIHAVNLDADASMAALGQVVRSPYTLPATLGQNVPAATVPNTGSQTVLYRDIAITQSLNAPIQWTGEEQKSVGAMYDKILRGQAAQALRALTNNIESTLFTVAYTSGSRAVGTAGQTPFNGFVNTANAMHDFANTAQVLDDNGTPLDNRFFVLNSSAYNNLRSMPNLYKVNQFGSPQMLKEGSVDEIEGFTIAYSGQNNSNVAVGTISSANITTQNVGDTVLTLTHGSGSSLLQGDIVSFAGDPNQYVVAAANSTTITIQNPGLLTSFTTNAAVTAAATGKRNIALHRDAIVLACRAPLMPFGGDASVEVELVTDPVSGITYQVAVYNVYRQVHIEVGVAYGANVVKPEFIAVQQG